MTEPVAKYEVFPTSSEEAEDLIKIVNRASVKYTGLIDELEKAIGMLFVGRQVGWKVLVLVHNKRTIRKYEDILGIKVREFFPEEGPLTRKSLGYKMAEKLGSFWKAVSGEVKIENRRELSSD